MTAALLTATKNGSGPAGVMTTSTEPEAHRPFWRALRVTITALSLVGVVSMLESGAAQAATTPCGPFTPCTYTQDGTFTVPQQAQWIHVHLIGGAGAPANHDGGAPGGSSISVDAWLDVSQAQYTNLTVHVGGNAHDTHGGANGGGDGGCGDYGPDTCSGGGGGESDIRYGTKPTGVLGGNGTVLAASPGGGGGGGSGVSRNDASSVQGGAGGTWSAEGPHDGGYGTGGLGGNGGGGSQQGPAGDRGTGEGTCSDPNENLPPAAPGEAGTPGYAGSGGSGGRGGGAAGGGGGAGYNGPDFISPDTLTWVPGGGGGGGGGSCVHDYNLGDIRVTRADSAGGGGAGAAYAAPSAQDVAYGAATSDPPEVVITWAPAATSGVTGRPYAYRYPGGGHYTDWSGTLPPGLTLAPDGLLSGTPTTPGTYGFTANRRNDAGEDTRWPVTITIDRVPPAVSSETVGNFVTGLGNLLGQLTEPAIEQGHGIKVTFTAKTTGIVTDRLQIPGAGIARARPARPKPVIATGTTRVTSLGKATLQMTLTPRGRRLLRTAIVHHRTLRIISLATFRPVGGAKITRSRRYRLRA